MAIFRMIRSGLALGLVLAIAARSEEIAQLPPQGAASELERLREENAYLRRGDTIQSIDCAMTQTNCRCFTDRPATTRTGALKIGGLIQVWYHQIENDHKGWEDGDAVLGASPAPFGSNEVQDNDTFRVRRAVLTFDFCVTDEISGHMKIDPAASALGFPRAPSNQAPFFNAGFQTGTGIDSGQFGAACNSAANTAANLCDTGIGNPFNRIVQFGGSNANALLQEAYINYHCLCWLPNHDISIGQMKRKLGEEGVRNDGELDFAERSMITQIADDYDLGFQIHGSWFCDRLQYWAGVFDGAGTMFQTRSNRPDDNDKKDFLGSIQVRPVWENCFWGSMELGYSGLWGKGGESAGNDPISNPVDGLNRRPTAHSNQYAWLYYAPGADLSGFWVRGEWGRYTDRFAPAEVATGLFNYTNDPSQQNVHGWYAAMGYHLGTSAFANCLDCWARGFEFVYRHEAMENLFYQSLVDTNRHLDIWETRVDTVGMNYYIKGHNAKIQVNYNFVSEQHDHSNGDRQIREVKNNNLIVNFQVAF